MTTHIAFDLGLTITGIAHPDGSDHFICPTKHRTSPITPTIEHQRFAWWRDTFRMILLPFPTSTQVIVEAPFTHRHNTKGAGNLYTLHGLLRGVAIDNGLDYHTVENRTLKKWATGNGNADKRAMLEAARMTGWIGDDHNEADAVMLWHYWDAGR